jgi:D-glycero-alpha-D-manno-heptose 1-phosphate guanylyltransferase
MQLVVLAGGLGTRLRGAIPDGLPKPMASIAGRPFLEHLFDRAILQGVTSIHLLVGHSADVIVRHFCDVYREVAVTYSVEQVPLGTGGALRAAEPELADSFLFVNGDTFADVDYRALFALTESAPLGMSLARVDDVSRYGSVAVAGDHVIDFLEKGADGSGLINAGAYACRRDLVRAFPSRAAFSFEVDFLQPELPSLRPRFVVVESGIIDIGTPESYLRANAVFGP